MDCHFPTPLSKEGKVILLRIGFLILSVVSIGHAGMASEKMQAALSDDMVDDAVDWSAYETSTLEPGVEASEEFTSDVHGMEILPTDLTTAAGETHQTAQYSESVSSVADVLRNGVGVQVRQIGGPGSSATVQIRGSNASQVDVYLDGIRLNNGGSASVDLGALNLDLFESIEVYRGAVPLKLGFGNIGGTVLLNTRTMEKNHGELSLSYGSFHTARGLALHTRKLGKSKFLVLASALLSKGDFEYLNRNGTVPLNTSDDRIQKRENNAHKSVSGLVKWSRRFGSWTVQTMDDVSYLKHGITGIDCMPTSKASMERFRNTVAFNATGLLSWKLTVIPTVSYLYHHYWYQDLEDEIGIGRQNVKGHSHTLNSAIVLQLAMTPRHQFDVRTEGTMDWFSINDLLQTDPATTGWRVHGGAGMEYHWFPFTALELVPSVRLTAYGSHAIGVSAHGVSTSETQNSSDYHVLPAVGFSARLSEVFRFTGNLGRYVREPDLYEQFGDQGAVNGNPELRAESGVNADFGLHAISQNLPLFSHLRWYGGIFGTWSDDLISYHQNSQNTIRAENIDSARVTGAETSMVFGISSWLRVSSNYTFLSTVNRSNEPYHRGRRLPGKPEHEAYFRTDFIRKLFFGEGSVYGDLDVASRVWLDPGNLEEDMLGRSLWGAGAKITHDKTGLTLTFEAKNLLNTIVLEDGDGLKRPLRDFRSMPLPGRSFFITLNWKV